MTRGLELMQRIGAIVAASDALPEHHPLRRELDDLHNFLTIDDPTYGRPPSMKLETFEDFAAVQGEGAQPLVCVAQSEKKLRVAIPAGGTVIVYGDGGAGKTSLLVDIAVHLAAGVTWCGLLEPDLPLRIAWIENEGPRPMMRMKLEEKLAGWSGPQPGEHLRVMSEPWGAFTFRDAALRLELLGWLNAMQTDLLVVGPLSRIGMEGGGTSDDIRAFLDLVEDVRASCDRPPAVLIVHHENRAGQISGAWEREPDTLVHVTGQGHGRTRVFWEKVRWGSDLHQTSSHLLWAENESFTVEAKPEITDETIAADILNAVLELPGGS